MTHWTPTTLVACDDPVELLARVGAYHGRQAVEAFHGRYGVPDMDDDDARAFLATRAGIDGHLAGVHARLAWRFASASLRLANADAIAQPYVQRLIDAQLADDIDTGAQLYFGSVDVDNPQQG